MGSGQGLSPSMAQMRLDGVLRCPETLGRKQGRDQLPARGTTLLHDGAGRGEAGPVAGPVAGHAWRFTVTGLCSLSHDLLASPSLCPDLS